MKIQDPGPETLQAATAGNLAALDRLLAGCQPGIYKLAVRVLGQRDDAADATQEILLKVATHLGSFRGESAFTTWVWRIAHNHLLTARTRAAEHPAESLKAMAGRLDQGLDLATTLVARQGEPLPLTPQDKLEAWQLALACTQSMLMAMDRGERQLPAARHQAAATAAAGRAPRKAVTAIHPIERLEAEQNLAAFTRVSDAAAVFRAHPAYRAPDAMIPAIRAMLTQEGFLQRQNPQ